MKIVVFNNAGRETIFNLHNIVKVEIFDNNGNPWCMKILTVDGSSTVMEYASEADYLTGMELLKKGMAES